MLTQLQDASDMAAESGTGGMGLWLLKKLYLCFCFSTMVSVLLILDK